MGMADPRKMSFQRRRAALMIMMAFLFAFGLLLAGCGKKGDAEEGEDDEKEPPAPVTVALAVRGAIDYVVTSDAVLYPVDQANVTPKIAAPVKRVLVNRGDHVRAGQVLAELESADLAAAVEESKHAVDQAQAALQLLQGATVRDDQSKAQSDVQTAQQALEAAKKVYEARAEMQRQGALASKMVDDARLAMAQAQTQLETAQKHLEAISQVGQREAIRGAEAQLNAAKAHVETLNVQLSYATIKSPIAGLIADRSVYPGEMVQPGTPLISLVDISRLIARANVPVRDAVAIKPGRPVRVAGPNGDLAGTVTVVSPTMDTSTTTVEVWVQVPNPGEKLKPGGTVRVSISAETIRDAIMVPATALLNSDDGGEKVMVIDKERPVALERKVVVGVRQGARVQVTSGLQEGDQVVTVGGLGLEDKARVLFQAPQSEDDKKEDAADK